MRKQWKPRHVVTIVVAVAIAIVGAPVAVGAATGQLVNIADGANAGQLAKVDTSGRLATTASVSGTVTAHQATPAATFVTPGSVVSSSSCTMLYTPPSGKAAVILDLQGNAYVVPNSTILRFWVSPTNSPCSGSSLPRIFMTSSDKPGTEEIDLGAGWGIPSGWALYVDEYVASGSPASWIATAQGYTTTSSSVPAPSAPTAMPGGGPSVGR